MVRPETTASRVSVHERHEGCFRNIINLFCECCLPSTPVASSNPPGMYYPMYVISVQDLLGLEELLPHQVMLKKGLLKEVSPQDMENHQASHGVVKADQIIFVSHEWLGFDSPDPEGVQLLTLKRILLRLMRSEIAKVQHHYLDQLDYGSHFAVHADEWATMLPTAYVWFDYLSVPQPTAMNEICVGSGTSDSRRVGSSSSSVNSVVEDLNKAVESIPAYIKQCNWMFVLVPVAMHSQKDVCCNLCTWRSRGWCRLELQAALLTNHDVKVMICASSEGAPYLFRPVDGFKLTVGGGEFTCCRLNHEINGDEICCDRTKVSRVMRVLIREKLRYLRARGLQDQERLLICRRHRLLHIFQEPEQVAFQRASSAPLAVSVKKFETLLDWSPADVDAEERTGRSLLYYAVLANLAPLVGQLLATASTSQVNAEITNPYFEYGERGETPLTTAMAFASFEIVEQLLHARANAYHTPRSGNDALVNACRYDRSDNVKAWLAHFPDWDLERRNNTHGFTALSYTPFHAAGADGLEVIRTLLAARSNVNHQDDRGFTALLWACKSEFAAPEVVSELLKARADVNAQLLPLSEYWKAKCSAAREAMRSGEATSVDVEISTWEGQTPLMAAMRMGKVTSVRNLLAFRADPNRKNLMNDTALDVTFSSFGGHPPQLLLEQLRRATLPAGILSRFRRKTKERAPNDLIR